MKVIHYRNNNYNIKLRFNVRNKKHINFETGHKEHLIEQEQALMVAKQRFREAQDELEELRSLIQDQSAQLEDYRNKYLQVVIVANLSI